VRKALLLGLVAGTPLLILQGITWGAVNTPKLFLLLTGLGLCLLLRATGLVTGCHRPWVTPLGLPLAAMVGPLALAWLVASPFRSWALWGAHERYLGLVPYVLCALFGAMLLDAFRNDGRPILASLVLSAAFVGLYGVIQRLGVDPIVWSPSPDGSTLGNPNYSGTFLGMAMPVVAWFTATTRGRRRDLALMASVPILAGWALANSQGGWAAGIVGVLVTGMFFMAPGWKRSLAGCAAAGVVVAVALAAPLALSGWGAKLLGPTVVDRGHAAVTALRMTADHPLMGRGPSAFSLEGVRYRPAEEALSADTAMNDPHSAFLAFLSSAGILGGVGFLAVAGWAAKRSIGSGSPLSPVGPAAGAVAAYFTGTLVATDELTLRIALWSSLAVLAGSTSRLPASTALRASRRAGAAAAAGLIGVAALVAGVRLIVADHSALQGFRAAQNNDLEAAIPHFHRAIATDPTYEYRKLFATKLGESATRRGEPGRPYYEEMNGLFRYLAQVPDLDALLRQARLSFAWGVKADRSELEEALALYEQARDIDPLHPLIAAETANVLIELGRASEATPLLRPFEPQGPPFPAFWLALARTYVETGHRADACNALRRATVAIREQGGVGPVMDVENLRARLGWPQGEPGC
jgi:O-antigen ligase